MTERRAMFEVFGIIIGAHLLGIGVPLIIVYGIGGLFFGYT